METDTAAPAKQKVRLLDVDCYLRRTTCSEYVRRSIFTYYPAARSSPLVFRYIAYVTHGGLCDKDTGQLLLSRGVLEWMDGKRFRGKRWGKHVLADLKEHFPLFEWDTYIAGKRARLLRADGLNPDLKALIEQDRATPARERKDRVYLLTGEHYSRSTEAAIRRAFADTLERTSGAPSETARYILDRMNQRPSNTFSRHLRPQVPKALDRLKQLDIKEDSLRRYYRRVLYAIDEQPQPFYQFSGRQRTDRIYPANPSALSLPSAIRDVLTNRFTKVDLKSAQLVIAAALWKCEDALHALKDEQFNIWKDLYKHLGVIRTQLLVVEEKKELKAALKTAVYSTIYGMSEAALKSQFTRATFEHLQHVDTYFRRGEEWVRLDQIASTLLTEHWIIRSLLDARNVELDRIAVEGRAETATGIDATVSEDRDPASVMATVAQSYEQAIMKAILEYEEEHQAAGGNDFRITLWIHDGCALHFTRRKRTHLDELKRRVRARSVELIGVPMMLEEE